MQLYFNWYIYLIIAFSDYTYAGQTSSKRQGILAMFDFIYNQFRNIFPSQSAKSF